MRRTRSVLARNLALVLSLATALVVALVVALVMGTLAGPASASLSRNDPRTTATPATVSVAIIRSDGRDDAIRAYGWAAALGFPRYRHVWAVGHGYWNSGGAFRNREGLLPSGGGHDRPSYYEYDMHSRPRNTHRDAYRIVVDLNHRDWAGNFTTWYTTDHYGTFRRLY
ncbi:ribonuclease domain-containing protein [Planotetraspora sp. GP83]|uniref:ribonuclease domain-containing protein n=1 Tax=Planotetraspora sp. GP83 TaxID=3156264 RepID=UPI0035128650